MKYLFIIGILSATLPVCSQAKDTPFPDEVPTTFYVQIGGGLDYRDSVELKHGLLYFKRTAGGKVQSDKSFNVHPSRGDWSRFVQEINAARLYRWSKNYPDPGVYDGMQWTVDIEISGERIHSEGNNNYPTDGNESKATNSHQPTLPFERLRQAVGDLIGRKY